MFINRFKILKDRMQKTLKYVFSNEAQNPNSDKVYVSDIGSLIGSQNKSKLIFGMIYEGLRNKFYMQDLYSQVSIDISGAELEQGYITSQCIVLAEGKYDNKNKIFIVRALYLPEYSLRPFANQFYNPSKLDVFGVFHKIQKIFSQIIEIQLKNKNNSLYQQFLQDKQTALGYFDLNLNPLIDLKNMSSLSVIVISDFLMTDSDILNRFDRILQGVQSSMNPLAFVFIGQFYKMKSLSSEEEYQQILQAQQDFLNVLDNYKDIKKKCYFIFIPHINDIGIHSYPKFELPASMCQLLEKNIPYFIRGQNPCRLSILGKEFIFHRNEILKDIRKQSIVKNESKQFDE